MKPSYIHVAHDIGERSNIASEHPEDVADLTDSSRSACAAGIGEQAFAALERGDFQEDDPRGAAVPAAGPSNRADPRRPHGTNQQPMTSHAVNAMHLRTLLLSASFLAAMDITPAGCPRTISSGGIRKPTIADTVKANVYADNWFILYINGELVAVDSISLHPAQRHLGGHSADVSDDDCRHGEGQRRPEDRHGVCQHEHRRRPVYPQARRRNGDRRPVEGETLLLRATRRRHEEPARGQRTDSRRLVRGQLRRQLMEPRPRVPVEHRSIRSNRFTNMTSKGRSSSGPTTFCWTTRSSSATSSSLLPDGKPRPDFSNLNNRCPSQADRPRRPPRRAVLLGRVRTPTPSTSAARTTWKTSSASRAAGAARSW